MKAKQWKLVHCKLLRSQSSSTNLYGAVTASDGCLDVFYATASAANTNFLISGNAPWNNARLSSLTIRRIPVLVILNLK
jgi:hypothetical protein